MTKEQLAAENERLGAEVAALRTLLTAVREYAAVPRPADWEKDGQAYDMEVSGRLGLIAVYADPDYSHGGPAEADSLHRWAEILRGEAARPLHYAVGQPIAAPEPEPSGMQSPRPVVRVTGVTCCGHCEHDEDYVHVTPCPVTGCPASAVITGEPEPAACPAQPRNPYGDGKNVFAICCREWDSGTPGAAWVCSLPEGHGGQHQAWSTGEALPFAVLDEPDVPALVAP